MKEISRRGFIRTTVEAVGISLILPSLANTKLINFLADLDVKKAEADPLTTDFAISSDGLEGHFYTQTRGDAPFPKGFAIFDDKEAQFWKRFQELGGVNLLGYPISNRFQMDGFNFQATQNFLLQNNPALGGVVLANTLDILNQKGLDPVLYNVGVPLHITDDGSKGNIEKSKEIHRSWLSDPEITKFYKNNPYSEEIYGYATSYPEKRGPFISQRFQRAVIIKWVEQTPQGQPVGTVQFGSVGDICKKIGLFPLSATTPSDIPQGSKVEENKYILPEVFREGDPSVSQSHITIDDGLSAYKSYLEQILNMAKEKQQKVTFFLIGSEMKGYPDLVRRIWKEGHGLENHTLDHPFLSKCTETEIRRQIIEQRRIAKEIVGDPSYQQKFFRPPYGDGIFNYDARIPAIAEQEGLKIAMWSMDNGPDVNRSINNLSKGSILLQHVKPTDFAIFNQLFDGVKNKGLPSAPLEVYS